MAETTDSGRATGTARQPTSPLLTFPTEFRNAIYELVLKDIKPIAVIRGVYTWYTPLRPAVSQPPLLLTCRAVRTEALPIFYSNNDFIAPVALEQKESYARAWLHAIGARNSGHLREVLLEPKDWALYCSEVERGIDHERTRFLGRVEIPGNRGLADFRFHVVKLDCSTFDD